MSRRTTTGAAAALLGVSFVLASGVPDAALAGPGATSVSADTANAPAPKVNANTASEAEIAAAFRAAQVPNAERWAHEVVEYRPYTGGWGKLDKELGKYGISPATLAKIKSVLTQ